MDNKSVDVKSDRPRPRSPIDKTDRKVNGKSFVNDNPIKSIKAISLKSEEKSRKKPELLEIRKKPEIKEVTKKQEIKEVTKKPELKESNKKSELKESSKKPELKEIRKKPEIIKKLELKETSKKPEPKEKSKKPEPKETNKKPETSERSNKKPEPKETNKKPETSERSNKKPEPKETSKKPETSERSNKKPEPNKKSESSTKAFERSKKEISKKSEISERSQESRKEISKKSEKSERSEKSKRSKTSEKSRGSKRNPDKEDIIELKNVYKVGNIYSDSEQESLRAKYRLKFRRLKESLKKINIEVEEPKYDILSIQDLKELYDEYQKDLHSQLSAKKYKEYMGYFFIGIETLFTNVFGFNMEGLADYHMKNMVIYDEILVELGLSTSIGLPTSWPPWVKLIVIVLANSLIFLLTKTLPSFAPMIEMFASNFMKKKDKDEDDKFYKE